jgi:hypothetical protein
VRQPACIFDRDGSLASVAYIAPQDRSNWAWQQYNAALPFDAVVPDVAALLRLVRPEVARIMVSGRAEGDWPGDRRRRFLMEGWIEKHDLPITHLFMRSGGDTRRDSIVKRELFERDIAPYFDVLMVVDDRPQVIQTWRDLGLYVVEVVDPDIMPPIVGYNQRGACQSRPA